MDDQRVEAYFNLINQLLTCPSGQELEALHQNRQLIDEGFLQAANYRARQLEENRKEESATFLFDLVELLSFEVASSISLDRQQAYLQLIKALLQCQNEQKVAILEANQELIDADLIKTMQQVAEEFDKKGKGSSEQLRINARNLALYLNNLQLSRDYLDLLIEILQTIESISSKELIYSLLQKNLEKLDEQLAQTLKIWANNILPTIEIGKQKHIANTIFDFSLFFQELSFGNRSNNIEIAITGYQIVLTIYTLTDFASHWARTQNNLANAYWQRIKGNKGLNIEWAIKCHHNALSVYTQSNFPKYWAGTQNNLAVAYKNRIRGDKANNIERAIECYQSTLAVYTQNDFPYEWATTQNNLANAYKNRIREDRADNIERAIKYYQLALSVYTQNDFPYEWARTYNNLTLAYNEKIKEDKADNIERAIECCQLALTVYTQNDFPYEWATAQNNLANAYSERIGEDRADSIEQALECYQLALTVYTQNDFPYEWAATQNNLANIYSERINKDRADSIERAIECYRLALTVYTQDGFPYKWAGTCNNLANSYSDRIEDNKSNNIKQAVKYYQLALTVRTPPKDPIECLRTSRNLGNLQFNQGNWQPAVDVYLLAIEAVEQSREWASTDERKQDIISNSIEVYQNIVQACINLGQMDKAIEYVERGKARNLVDLLATRELYPKGDIPKELIARLDSLRKKAIAEERLLRQQSSLASDFDNPSAKNDKSFSAATPSNNATLNRDRLNQIKQELNKLVTEHIQPVDPSFQLTQRVEPISFKEIRSALPTEQTALIEWYIGNDTLSAFIVTRQEEIPVYLNYSEEQFLALVDIVNLYYDSYLPRNGQWQNNLPGILDRLAQGLQLPTIINRVKQLIPDCDRLILVPHRWLHILPIHALPLPDSKYLLDLFTQGVSYAPSVQLLKLTQKQSKSQLTNFFAVQNPTGDLEFTNIEVRAIRSLFKPNDDVLEKEQATKSAFTKERLGQVNLTHFSCHGYFNFKNPELSALLLADCKVKTSIEKEDKKEKDTRFLTSRDGANIDLEKCLTLGEIFGYDLRNCRLVTLSACETGLIDFRSLSDEYIGLPSGFLYAGSPSVVSSLWTVDDISTSFLMIKFYQNLQEIDSVAIALNQAQLWLRSVTKEKLLEWKKTLNIGFQMWKIDAALVDVPDNSRPFASPYYWAAFCAVGS